MCIARMPATVLLPVYLPQHSILRGWLEARTSRCHSSGVMPTEAANSTGLAGNWEWFSVRYVSRTRRISLTNAKLTL